jgi:hypothetical protein
MISTTTQMATNERVFTTWRSPLTFRGYWFPARFYFLLPRLLHFRSFGIDWGSCRSAGTNWTMIERSLLIVDGRCVGNDWSTYLIQDLAERISLLPRQSLVEISRNKKFNLPVRSRIYRIMAVIWMGQYGIRPYLWRPSNIGSQVQTVRYGYPYKIPV